MGVDAFWFCDNCKVEYKPRAYGGRDLLAVEAKFSNLTWQEVDNWIKETRKLVSEYSSIGEDVLIVLIWFEELRDFLKRHDGHGIHLLNDSGGLHAGEYVDENGVTWNRLLDFVGENEPTPDKPKYGSSWRDFGRTSRGEEEG